MYKDYYRTSKVENMGLLDDIFLTCPETSEEMEIIGYYSDETSLNITAKGKTAAWKYKITISECEVNEDDIYNLDDEVE